MSPAQVLRLSWASMQRAPTRSKLTVTGVLVATAALVVLTTLSASLQLRAQQQFSRNNLLLDIRVFGGFRAAGPADFLRAGGADPPPPFDDNTVRQLAALRGVEQVTPSVSLLAAADVDGRPAAGSVTGVSFAPQPPPYQLDAGRMPAPEALHEALVSSGALRDLKVPTPAEALGQRLTLVLPRSENLPDGRRTFSTRAYSFTLVGVIGDGIVPVSFVVPLPVLREARAWSQEAPVAQQPQRRGGPRAQRQGLPDLSTFGQPLPEYSDMSLRVSSVDMVEPVQRQVQAMGYRTFAPEAILKRVEEFFLGLEAVLILIGVIALAIASLGIVNTLLMAVLERTREIGVLKAIGATDRQVAALFLTEAALMGVVGGVLGLLVGRALSLVIDVATNWYLARRGAQPVDLTYLPPWVIVTSLALTVGVSVVAGIFPARRAWRLSPVAALRAD